MKVKLQDFVTCQSHQFVFDEGETDKYQEV